MRTRKGGRVFGSFHFRAGSARHLPSLPRKRLNEIVIQGHLLNMLLALLCLLPREAPGVITGKWSKPVEGLRARAIVSPGAMYQDVRRLDVRVELENVSDVANPIVVLYDPLKTLRGRMIDAQGKQMGDFWGAMDMLTPSPYPLTIPYRGSTVFLASAQGHYGMPSRKGARMIELTEGIWIIDANATATLSLTLSANGNKPGQWHGALSLPPIQIPAKFPAE